MRIYEKGILGFFPAYNRWLTARYWIGVRFVLYSMKWLFIPKEMPLWAYCPGNLAIDRL
ncbi:hypothetical protein [Pedobacter sp.]|uniref:hypothetical protein n=1 Tax=Pedobacter sp. TaxID=1411316 RepID=UPI002C2912EA|nr:hypothetical protein [Pedobacter sp.]HWW42289.1 hypothetical protein [Pedobacter sp.]